MTFPDMPEPAGGRRHELTHADGTHRTVWTRDVEVPFPDGRLIISRVDLTGRITHANESFVEMSGYTRQELMNAPHCVLRHPDMPRAVFKELWDTLSAGKKWHGYVKNLRKDGGFYWVYASAVPNVREGKIVGYTSVRRKPSRKRIEEATALYAQLRAAEA
jgi:PAS domain S-box-containing protein